jgi:hypothetical protein
VTKHRDTANTSPYSRQSDPRGIPTRKLTKKLALHPFRSRFILSNGDRTSMKHFYTISTRSSRKGKTPHCFTWVPSARQPGRRGRSAGVCVRTTQPIKFYQIHALKGSRRSSTMVTICNRSRPRDSCRPFVLNLVTHTPFPALSLLLFPSSPLPFAFLSIALRIMALCDHSRESRRPAFFYSHMYIQLLLSSLSLTCEPALSPILVIRKVEGSLIVR